MNKFKLWMESKKEEENSSKKGFIKNIEGLSFDNKNFRKVLYTTKNLQLVVMSLNPNEDIGEEIHNVDQFFRIESGNGEAIINNKSHIIKDGSVVIVPAGTKHNIINSGSSSMKLYTIYSPPHHKDGTIHRNKKDSEKDKEHFDGKFTE